MLLINSIHQIYYYTNIFNGSIEPEKLNLKTLPQPAEIIGSSGSSSTNRAIVSMEYKFIAGVNYLILATTARTDRSNTGIIQTELRVDGAIITRQRTFGGSSLQMGVSLQRLHKTSTTKTSTLSLYVSVLSGGSGFEYEDPAITVVPLISNF